MIKLNATGRFALIVFAILIGLSLITSAAIFLWQKESGQSTVCTQEAKQCPDGSYVSRTGPNCEFAQCPSETPMDTSTWQIYRNEEYGFEFKYPIQWTLEEQGDYLTFTVSLNPKDNIHQFNTFQIDLATRALVNGNPEAPFKEIDLQEKINDSRSILQDPLEGRITIGGIPAVRVSGTTEGGNLEGIEVGGQRSVSIVLIRNSWQLFSIDYLGFDGDFEKEFNAILSTLKFFKPEVPVGTSNWQTYRNEKYGFEVKYPSGWQSIGILSGDPQPPAPLAEADFADLQNQFRSLRIFIWDKNYQQFDLSGRPEQVIVFFGGTGTRFGNDFFVTKKDGYSIHLWYTDENYEGKFFTDILSTFKFIN